MKAKKRLSPYHDHINHWDVPEGKIGTKATGKSDKGKNEIYWEAQDKKIYIVCPQCRTILHIPDWIICGDGEITCMVCTKCRVDYSYTLIGWEKPKT